MAFGFAQAVRRERDLKSKSGSFWTEAAERARGGEGPTPVEGVVRKSIRREFVPAEPRFELTDDQLRLRLAEELDYARRMLDALGDQLSIDAAVVARHGTALQSLDIAGQMLGHIANIVRSNEPDEAVERIGMGDLKARLSRKSVA
jgi:hypothetical protein